MIKIDYKNIPTLITVVTPLIIGVGILGTAIYYDSYGIIVLDYITLDEVLVLFLKHFSTFIACSIVGLIIGFVFGTENPNKDSSDSISPKRKSKFYKNFLIRILIANFFIFFFFSHYGIFKYGKLFFIGVMFFRGVIGMAIAFKLLNFKLATPLSSFYMSVTIVFLVMIYTISDFQSMRQYNYPEKKHIYLNNLDTIDTGGDTLYVGKTKNYLFFYLKEQKESYVIKADLVTAIVSK